MYSKKIEEALTAKHVSVGDKIRLTTETEPLEGILMPRPEAGSNEIIIIKLDNGYNIGIKFTDDAKISKLDSHKERFVFPESKFGLDQSLPKISLIYTGGTIGSKLDYTTGGMGAGMLTNPKELLYEVPELARIANLDVDHLMSVASEDMSHVEWGKMAEATASALNNGSIGVVITIGTDTLHYASAALSFMLSGLTGPVVITAAQRSRDRGSSDAFMNLVCAAHLAAASDIGEVGVCMHGTTSDDKCTFIRGTKVRKMHTSSRAAFQPINNAPIARVDVSGKIEYESEYARVERGKRGWTTAKTGFEPKVAMVTAYPGSDPAIIDYYVGQGYKGLVIAGTGLGEVPVDPALKSRSWIPRIKDAVASGMVVGITSQCLYGRVSSNVYRNMRLVAEVGGIHCEDMMSEVAYVKLGFLLGNYPRKKAEELLPKNLVGEITARTEVDWFGE